MSEPPAGYPVSCRACLDGAGLDFEFDMALQPIVDLEAGSPYAQEALVRGPQGEPAPTVLEKVDETNRYRFDQACRARAVKLAGELGLASRLSINFTPSAVYKPEHCIRTTLEAAERFGFPAERLIFEFTENEEIDDPDHLLGIVRHYQQLGMMTALDDFGAGFARLNLLADLQPDLVKVDIKLVRDIDRDAGRQAVVGGIVEAARDLGARLIAEGVETAAERDALRAMGITLQQGFLFARPAFRCAPEIAL